MAWDVLERDSIFLGGSCPDGRPGKEGLQGSDLSTVSSIPCKLLSARAFLQKQYNIFSSIHLILSLVVSELFKSSHGAGMEDS